MATVSVSVGSLIERATAQPKRFLVPHGLLVNHDGFGLGLGQLLLFCFDLGGLDAFVRGLLGFRGSNLGQLENLAGGRFDLAFGLC